MTKNFWHDIESGIDIPEIINVIVEIPKGSMNKYEYDKKHNLIKLDRVLFSPFHYPGDYGLVPQTLSEDGDPLDAMVLVTNPTYPGILIEARPIGLLQMKDDGKIDDKIICVSTNDPRYLHAADITDIEDHYRSEIAHFFQVYKDLEGKKVEIPGWQPSGGCKIRNNQLHKAVQGDPQKILTPDTCAIDFLMVTGIARPMSQYSLGEWNLSELADDPKGRGVSTPGAQTGKKVQEIRKGQDPPDPRHLPRNNSWGSDKRRRGHLRGDAQACRLRLPVVSLPDTQSDQATSLMTKMLKMGSEVSNRILFL